MLETLISLYKQKKYAAIYTDADNCSKFIYGRIICVNKAHIAIEMVSPDGGFDGIVAKITDDIFRIEIDGQYSDKMQKLISLCSHKAFDHSLDDGKIFESLLLLARDAQKVVALELLGSGYDDVVGFIVHIENGLCTIRQIDGYGFEDGVSIVKVDEITQISYASHDENRILKLWQLNNKSF